VNDYAHPEVLVSTDWVDEHKDDANVAVVEVDVDTAAYEEGHIPGAVAWNWQTQLCDTLQRDIISQEDLEKLLGESGIGNDTTIVLYGDNNNWFAAWALWQIKLYQHDDVRIMDGGRKKWLAEGRDVSTESPAIEQASYKAQRLNPESRILLSDVQEAIKSDRTTLVDVRSPDEFTGKILSPPGLPETCQRGGHIPKAQNIPWGMTCNEDGTFKNADELKELYASKGVTSEKDVIAYCRIGERSSHSWFALKYLLGYPNVKNYDGSWTEWGNLVGAPVEK
jgi:thiosulfate/3-mercaptopyruvate sulfurtransferase